MNEIIHTIYEMGTVTGRSGKVHKLHSSIDPQEGEFLFNIVYNDSKVLKTLEIGCAYGLASLHICLAAKGRIGASHTIVDPFENTLWDGVGTRNLEEAGIDFFKLIEVQSEFALPRLLEKNEGQFDFIFIDGWHTFDHTLLDCFYANRLLRIGGYLAVDDVGFPSVNRAVSFLKNYPCYEEHGSVSDKSPKSWKKTVARSLMFPLRRESWAKILNPTLCRRVFEDPPKQMVALKKIAEDCRDWNWHDDAF